MPGCSFGFTALQICCLLACVCVHVSEIYTVIHSDLYHQTAFLCNTSIPGRLGLSPCHEGSMCHGDVISIILFLQLSLWTLMSMCDLQVNQCLCKWDWIMMSYCLWGEESADLTADKTALTVLYISFMVEKHERHGVEEGMAFYVLPMALWSIWSKKNVIKLLKVL